MKEQPWHKDKRSWIFYYDKIKTDENMVWGETKESIFLLDCETARLSIWSKKWETFTDVGISNLLKRMSTVWNGNSKEVLGGTRVFYKGIELQNKCMADDTELLEFIDIKGGLERSYINISRNGFTEAGERFFEEILYPGLMDMIQEVLKELEVKSCKKEEKNEKGFDKKISDTVQRLCDDIVQKKYETEEEFIRSKETLISLVGTVAVLAYLAMRDEWDVWENYGGGHPRNGAWENLVKKIDEILSNPKCRGLLEELRRMTSLFGIKVYGEDYKEEFERGERNQIEKSVNFLKLFLTNEHWAILQCRRDGYSSWSSHLIRLREETFSKLTAIPRSEKDECELELWGKRMCDIIANERYEDFFTLRSFQQQILLEWILKNIPTVGLFCNEQGNVRLNVLAGRIYPSIYLDRNFKCLILERMIEKAWKDDIQRFSAITWQGREYISSDKLPFSVYFIKRGYLSDYSYHKCIVPIEGEILKQWHKVLEKIEESDLAHKVAELLRNMDILTYLKEIQWDQRPEDKKIKDGLEEDDRNVELEIASEVWDRIFSVLRNRKDYEKKPIEVLLDAKQNWGERWKKVYDIAVNIYMADYKVKENDGEMQSYDEVEDELNSLCDAWLYCCIFREDIVGKRSETRKVYEDYHPHSLNKDDKIVQYIINGKGPQFSADALKAGILEYREELVGLAQELETRQIREYLEENMRTYRMFTVRLVTEYCKANGIKQEKKRDLDVINIRKNV